MTTKFHYLAIPVIIFSTALSISAQQRTNLLDTMSNANWKALNLFFSNFCEATGFSDFNAKAYDDKTLIEYAMQHNVLNNRGAFKEDTATGEYYLSKATVDATIQKSFGIAGIKAGDFEEDFFACRGGMYYWLDTFEGGPWFAGGQIIEFYNNGDGTYSAVIEKYVDGEGYGYSDESTVSMSSNSPFYAPKKTWSKKITQLLRLDSYYAAKAAPQAYNNKSTYKLLEWHRAETLQEARNMIK